MGDCMTSLAGRTAIITGAGRGIGREHALLFAKLGARVVVNDVAADSASNPANDVVSEIRALGGEAVAHSGSVSNWNSAKELVELAVDTFGGLDVLVNNAGILRDRVLVNMSEQEWDSVMDVHLKGHFCPLRHAAAYWRAETKAGRPVAASVVNTSSGSGLRGNPGQINYASAKAGIAAMTVVAARELDRYGVRVNAIAPVARTRLTDSVPGLADRFAPPAEGFDKWSPENISPLVAYLASTESHATGQVFTVLGGYIGRQQGWTEQESIDRDERWTVDGLASALAHLPATPPELSVNY
jgi:NAD(P)-dependent dehydrogenase (short-subunit alcohol dehydrogenase family)